MTIIRKLSQGGDLFNILEANAKWPVPQAGDGATILLYSDRHAGTVIAVEPKGKSVVVTVQEDNAKLVGGSMMSESQQYEYSPNPDGSKTMFKLTHDGRWRAVYVNQATGRLCNSTSSVGVRFGARNEYRDPCF